MKEKLTWGLLAILEDLRVRALWGLDLSNTSAFSKISGEVWGWRGLES